MREYAKVASSFWDGPTGRRLRSSQFGQLVAMYLLSGKHSNMIGMYQLPIAYIAGDTGLTIDESMDGLRSAIDAGFCDYDFDNEVVWVYEMARYQIADSLSPNDKQTKGIHKLYSECPNNKFLSAFFDKYGAPFCMPTRRVDEGAYQAPYQGASKGLTKGLSKGLTKPEEQESSRAEEQENSRTARATVAEVIPIDPPKQKSTIPPEIKPVLDGLTAELMDANRKKSRSYKPNTAMLITWPGELHDLMESRGLSCQELVSMLRWSQADDFWHATIQSPADLAKHLDKIAAQMKRKQGGIVSASQSAPPVGEDLGEGFVRVG